MQNLSDNELDDLFRRAAQQSETEPYAENSAWDDMAPRLNDHVRSSAWINGSGILSVFTLIICSVALIWDNFREPEILALTSVNNIRETPSGKIQDQEAAVIVKRDNSGTDRMLTVEPNDPGRDAIIRNPSVKPNLDGFDSNKMQLLEDSRSERDGYVVNPQNIGLSTPATVRTVRVLESEVTSEKPDTADANEQPDQVDQIAEIADEEETRPVRPGLSPRLAIKVSVSPDYSSVEFSRPQSLGFNYGVLVEYHLSNRFSLVTGAIRARKFYSAMDLEYNGYHADRVNGDCKMWDIPLNLYYHFSGTGSKWSWYAGTGFSSYLMSEENYTYEVKGGYGSHWYENQVKNENNEWFSILNLSIGIQRNLNDRFSIQIEPYIKAPLAGVGEGDVSLASFGAFFNLKYNFFKTK